MKALLAALALTLALAAPAGAQLEDQAGEPAVEELRAVPRELRAGEPVTVSGSGCAPGNQVRFELRNPDLKSAVASDAQADGSFVETIVLPSTTKAGRTWLRASCLTSESTERVMEAVLLVRRPDFVVTWTNVLFGFGAAMLTGAIGLALVRPDRRRRSSQAGAASGRRRRRRSSSRSDDHATGPDPVEVSANAPTGPGLNGKKNVDPSKIEVD